MIPLFKVHMPESVIEPVNKTLLSGYIGQGPKVDEFEKALVPWVGHPNVVTVNSGTSALHLALRIAGVTQGTEVISTPMTCAATNEPILERGGEIVWADIDPWTGNIDPLDVERKITSRTKAVMAVDWGGYPCAYKALLGVSLKYGVPIIEDAAHAFGATYRGRQVGSICPFTCFSFQAIKHVTTIEGGALVAASNDHYREAKLLRWYGIDRETPRRDMRCEEDIKSYGYKFHMNDVSAAIGIEQLKHAGEILSKHRKNADYYNSMLKGVRGVDLLRYSSDTESSYWIYTMRVDDVDSFIEHLRIHGVMSSRVHIRNDVHTAFRLFRRNLPGVDEFSKHQVSIPVGWWLSEENRSAVVEAVQEWSASR